MKKITFAIVAMLAVGGTVALADVLLPNAAVVSGADATTLNAKIAQVTGKAPSVFMGRKVLSANAQVVCSEFSNGQVSCQVEVQK